jgi:hypothetical protein
MLTPTEGLRAFLEAHPNAAGGVVLHAGAELRYLGERIMAIPWPLLAR